MKGARALLLVACVSGLRAPRGGPRVIRREAGSARRLTPEEGAEDFDYEQAYRSLVDQEPTLSERFKRLRSGGTTTMKSRDGPKSLDPPTRPRKTYRVSSEVDPEMAEAYQNESIKMLLQTVVFGGVVFLGLPAAVILFLQLNAPPP